jgi:plasmid stabilization system protein ParE
MARKIKVYSLALRDIETAAVYYQLQQKGLGKRFEKEVHSILKRIQKFPFAASVSHEHVRYKVADHFPHIILYEFDDKNIYILRVFNTNQEPSYLPDL